VATFAAESSTLVKSATGVAARVSAFAISAAVALAGVAASIAVLPSLMTPTLTVPIAVRVAAVPRAGSDENPVRKIARSIVAIRRAGVRIVIVISVSADGRSGDIRMPNHNADRAYSDSY
jgi:hypothetical protein